MNPDVIVVGGGIAGTTVAWELARRGTRVELFEQAALAAGASGRNTGTLLHQVEPVVAAMLRESEERYRELQDGNVDFRWTQREELLLARDPAQLRVVEQKAAILAQQGVATESVAGDDLRAASRRSPATSSAARSSRALRRSRPSPRRERSPRPLAAPAQPSGPAHASAGSSSPTAGSAAC